MQQKKIVKEQISTFKKGLDLQREQFKAAKILHEVNYEIMCDSIENIKSEIKPRLIKRGQTKTLKRIEKIIHWYRTLGHKFTKRNQEGTYTLHLPPNIEQKINKNLTTAYELLIKELDNLGLL